MAACASCDFELAISFSFCPRCGSPVVNVQTRYTESESKPTAQSLRQPVGFALQNANTVVRPERAPELTKYEPDYNWINEIEWHVSEYRDVEEFNDLHRGGIWGARMQPGSATGPRGAPIPDLRIHTPLEQTIRAALLARRNYEPFDGREFATVRMPLLISYRFHDESFYDVQNWRLVIDPDGRRLQGHLEQKHAERDPEFDELSHRGVFSFDYDIYAEQRVDTPMALVRFDFGEVRYWLPASAL